jgi:hypothetical protein
VFGDAEIQTWERKKNQKKSELLRVNAAGGFPEPIYEVLSQDGLLLIAIAKQLLVDHFSNTLHDRILETVGLDVR